MTQLSSYPVSSFQYFHIRTLQGKVCIPFVLNLGCKSLWGKELNQLSLRDRKSLDRKFLFVLLQLNFDALLHHSCNNSQLGNPASDWCYLFQTLDKFYLLGMNYIAKLKLA